MSAHTEIIKVLTDITKRLERIEATLSKGGVPAPSTGAAAGCAQASAYTAYLEVVNATIPPFMKVSEELGGDINTIAEAVKTIFGKFMAEIIDKSTQCKKPEMEQIPALFTALGEAKKMFAPLNTGANPKVSYVKAVNEATAATNMFFAEEPSKCVEEAKSSAQFWSNKIRVEAKNKKEDKPQEWAQKLTDIMVAVSQFAQKFYPKGFTWNEKGVDVTQYKPGSAPTPITTAATVHAAPAVSSPTSSARKPATKAPPPPAAATTTTTPAPGARVNLMSELSKKVDGGLSSNLKHVDKSEMSHKNPAIRGNLKMEVKETKVDSNLPPPKLEHQPANNKWVVEYQTGKVEVEVTMSETVYCYGCVGATIVVKGKGKSAVIDKCKKTCIVVDKLVSTVEVVNTQQSKVQVLSSCPTIAIDKSDGCTVFIPRSAIDNTTFTTSKCSDLNVSFPSAQDEQEWIEKPLPEQYVHRIKNDVVHTDVSDLYSH